MTRRVLVVDDEPTIRELVADALREAGFSVEEAANGAEALQLMARKVPEAIVLDVMMPKLDAQGFVELARLNPRFSAIPILVLTATYAAFEAAERLGAHACLTKPFELDELISTVRRMVGALPLPNRQSAAQAAPVRSAYERDATPGAYRDHQRRYDVPRADA